MVCVLRLLLMAGAMAGAVESKGGANDQVTKEAKKIEGFATWCAHNYMYCCAVHVMLCV